MVVSLAFGACIFLTLHDPYLKWRLPQLDAAADKQDRESGFGAAYQMPGEAVRDPLVKALKPASAGPNPGWSSLKQAPFTRLSPKQAYPASARENSIPGMEGIRIAAVAGMLH
jgi:hypothetical protein